MRLFLLVLTSCLSFAQQGGPASSPVFSSESRLVLLSFNVQRGKYYAPDLKPEDVMLIEDGRPRAFTVFEGPSTGSRPPLELALLFDTTTLPPPNSGVKVGLANGPGRTLWDRDATYGFAAQWTEAESRKILERTGADVRVSVYRYDHQQLQKLCRSTKEPRTLTNAIHRLPELIPANEAIRLKLPPGRIDFRSRRSAVPLITPADDLRPKAVVGWPMSWTLEAVIHTLRDSAVEQETAMRVLIVFSETLGPTSTQLEDAAQVALSLNIPVYVVVLDLEQYIRSPVALAWTKGVRNRYTPAQEQVSHSRAPEDSTAAGGLDGRSWTLSNLAVETMLRFGDLGPLTGGEAIFPSEMNRAALNDILGVIRDKSLSQYVVGFVPASSARPRKHDLKIRIQAKEGGKLVGGERTAVY
jgi:hypothetical protein